MLRGKAKTDYQRDYMRKRRKIGLTGSNTGLTNTPVQPNVEVLRQIIKNIESKPQEKPIIPLYNPAIHKPGDRVLVRPRYGKSNIETVIPELDAGGQPIPDYD